MIFSASNAPFTSGNSIDTTLDAAFTVDSLQFRSVPPSVNAVTIAPGTGGMLTLTPVNSLNGIRVDADAGAIGISAPLTASVAQTWSVDGTGVSSLAVSGDVTFTGNVNKTGSGALALSGNNIGGGGITYTGPTTLMAGTLELNATTAMASPITSQWAARPCCRPAARAPPAASTPLTQST